MKWTSEEVLAYNRKAASKGHKVEPVDPWPDPPPAKPKKRLRQSARKMNKLETEALGWLRARAPHWSWYPQAITFRLGNGVRYTPDVVGMSMLDSVVCYEVKGPRMWDDANVKLKVAAHEFQHVKFVLLWRENGRWCEQVVLP